jgi:hypothetical protein
MSKRADDYREQADRAKRSAEQERDPDIKQQWLEVERSFRFLADSTDGDAQR